MCGHNKWSQIKRQKGVNDAKKSKAFAKLGKVITLAAKHGGEVEMNPTLKLAVDKAKAVNMPAENIKKAIKKGTGELAEQSSGCGGSWNQPVPPSRAPKACWWR